MITVIRTATAFPGMTGEALSWAKEIAALVKRVTGKEQIVCSAEIAWIGQYDSVGQYDEMRTKILSDGDYRTALKKARDLFTADSGRLRRIAAAIRFGNTNRKICEYPTARSLNIDAPP
jgi:hypothetical protein